MTRDNTGKRLLKFIGLTLLFVIIIGYGIWKGRDLLFGIQLTIYGIQNNETVKTPVLNVSGLAYHAVAITIDGRTVSVEEDGRWQDTIALLNGYNIVSVSAKDKFNRIVTKTFTVNYDAPPNVQPEIPPPPETATSGTTTDYQESN